MKLQVLMFYQDDPKKCTAAKMIKFGLARDIKKIPIKSIVLHPFAENFLLPYDRLSTSSIIGIDCSWRLAEQEFSKSFSGIKRKLPPLLAGNPVNYAKIGKLTTAEAFAASLYILGKKQQSSEVLSKFKWGHTFLELNQNLLDEYSKISSETEIEKILYDYGLVN